jgi:hypothetical protein
MTNITNNHRFNGDRNRAIDRASVDSYHWIVQLIPIALLTAFMLFAVINPMW